MPSSVYCVSAGKAPDIDGKIVELLKADLKSTVDVLHTTRLFSVTYGSVRLFLQIGERVLLSGLPKKGISPSAEIGGGLL